MSNNDISLVIPVFNEEKNIIQCINSILSQKSLPREVIFVDNYSTDASLQIINKLKSSFKIPVKIIQEEKKGIPFVRNRGIKEASGTIVTFLDSDCIAPKDYIKSIIDGFKHYDVEAVTGRYLLRGENCRKAKFRERIWSEHFGWNLSAQIFDKLDDQIGTLVSGCTAYKKEVLFKLGLFDERVIYMDDIAMSYIFYRQGFKAFFTPHIIVTHLINTSELSIVKKDLRYGYDHANINKIIKKNSFIFYWGHYRRLGESLIAFLKTGDFFYLFLTRTLIYHKLGLFWRGILLGCLYI